MIARSAPPALDPGVRRAGAGRLLIGGSPPRLVRLSDAGAAALDRLLAGRPEPGDAPLEHRLRERGILHPVAGGTSADVTFVVPVRDGGESLVQLIGQLHGWGEVIVVDDGSSDDSGGRAAAAGARVLANQTGMAGPAIARNVGLAATESEFVAFVDADCRCERDWARPLAGLLAQEPGLGLAAPRVRGAVADGAIAAYERWRSPLDMGVHPGLVGPGRKVAYVPSAALVARRATLVELGGFDPSLRFGEDVDLVWRAVAAGWSVRYAPELEVAHLPRTSRRAFARQRFEYGSSAAALGRRHPGAVAPLRIDRGAGLVCLAALAAGRRGGLIAAAAYPLRASLKRRDREAAPALAALAARGLLHSGRELARASARDWLPATALACLLSRRARPYAAAALGVDAATGFRVDRRLLLPPALLLRGLENGAYAAGLWRGVLRERSLEALAPRWHRGST